MGARISTLCPRRECNRRPTPLIWYCSPTNSLTATMSLSRCVMILNAVDMPTQKILQWVGNRRSKSWWKEDIHVLQALEHPFHQYFWKTKVFFRFFVYNIQTMMTLHETIEEETRCHLEKGVSIPERKWYQVYQRCPRSTRGEDGGRSLITMTANTSPWKSTSDSRVHFKNACTHGGSICSRTDVNWDNRFDV